jgi:uncharacterized membrane protein required for colicin V production
MFSAAILAEHQESFPHDRTEICTTIVVVVLFAANCTLFFVSMGDKANFTS